VSFVDAEKHYRELLSFFKNLVWVAGGLFVIAGGLFYSNLRDIRKDAKDEAIRVATDESRDAVKKAFEEEHVKKLVEDVAKEKISAVTDEMVAQKVNAIADNVVEQHLTSKIQPIEESIVLIGRVSELETRIHGGSRVSLIDLMGIARDAHDKYVREFAQATLNTTTKNYEDFWADSVKQTGTNSAQGLLSGRWAKPGQPQPTGTPLANVVYAIRNNDDLNVVTLAFLSFRELTGEKVKMFDFSAVNSWCDKHQGQCK